MAKFKITGLPKAQTGKTFSRTQGGEDTYYIHPERPGSIYTKWDGKWHISNSSTGFNFEPIKDPTGERKKNLNANAVKATQFQLDRWENLNPYDNSKQRKHVGNVAGGMDPKKSAEQIKKADEQFMFDWYFNTKDQKDMHPRDASNAIELYNKGLDFHKGWMNSPMYKKMLANSINAGKASGVDESQMAQQRIQNFSTIPSILFQRQPEGRSFTGGQSMPTDGSITIFPYGSGVSDVSAHEISHSIDRPVNYYDSDQRLIPQADINYIQNVTPAFNNTPKWQGYDADWQQLVLNNPEYLQEEKDWVNYVSKPTEVRARLNAIRAIAKESGTYDPYTQEVTPEIYDMLQKMSFGTDEKEGFNPIEQLKGIYSDEQIIEMLNSISKNDNDSGDMLNMAREGGFLPHAQFGFGMGKLRKRKADKQDQEPAWLGKEGAPYAFVGEHAPCPEGQVWDENLQSCVLPGIVEQPTMYASADPETNKKRIKFIDKANALWDTIEGRKVWMENGPKNYSLNELSKFVHNVKDYKDQAAVYEKYRRMAEDDEISGDEFARLYNENNWIRFDQNTGRENFKGQWRKAAQEGIKKKAENAKSVASDIGDILHTAGEYTGINSVGRVISNPIDTFSGAGQTIVDIGMTAPEIPYMAYDYLSNLFTPWNREYGNEYSGTEDINPFTGQPYWSGAQGAIDLLTSFPLFKGAFTLGNTGFKAGVNAVNRIPSSKVLFQSAEQRLGNPTAYNLLQGTESGVRGKIADKYYTNAMRTAAKQQDDAYQKFFKAYDEGDMDLAKRINETELQPAIEREKLLANEYGDWRRQYSGLPIRNTGLAGSEGSIFTIKGNPNQVVKVGTTPNTEAELNKLIEIGQNYQFPGSQFAFPTRQIRLMGDNQVAQFMPRLNFNASSLPVGKTFDDVAEVAQDLNQYGVGLDYAGEGNIGSVGNDLGFVDLAYIGKPGQRVDFYNRFPYHKPDMFGKGFALDETIGSTAQGIADDAASLMNRVRSQGLSDDALKARSIQETGAASQVDDSILGADDVYKAPSPEAMQRYNKAIEHFNKHMFLPESKSLQGRELLDDFISRINSKEGLKRLGELGINDPKYFEDLVLKEIQHELGYFTEVGGQPMIALHTGMPAEIAKNITRHEIEHAVQRAIIKNGQQPFSEIDYMLNGLTLKGTPNVAVPREMTWNAIEFPKNAELFPDLQKNLDYYAFGSGGKEKSAFLAEVQQGMLDNGIIDDVYENITPEKVKKAYKQFIEDPNPDKYTYRFFEIMEPTEANFELTSKALNKMLAIPGAIGGVGTAGYMMNQGATEQPVEGLKKGGAVSKKYSRSLEAKNQLYTENRLVKKRKPKNKKIFSPTSPYFKMGGIPDLPLNENRQVLRDWTYGESIGMLQEEDGGIIHAQAGLNLQGVRTAPVTTKAEPKKEVPVRTVPVPAATQMNLQGIRTAPVVTRQEPKKEYVKPKPQKLSGFDMMHEIHNMYNNKIASAKDLRPKSKEEQRRETSPLEVFTGTNNLFKSYTTADRQEQTESPLDMFGHVNDAFNEAANKRSNRVPGRQVSPLDMFGFPEYGNQGYQPYEFPLAPGFSADPTRGTTGQPVENNPLAFLTNTGILGQIDHAKLARDIEREQNRPKYKNRNVEPDSWWDNTVDALGDAGEYILDTGVDVINEIGHWKNMGKRYLQKQGWIDIEEQHIDPNRARKIQPKIKETPKVDKFYQEIATVKDEGYSDNDLLSYRSQWDNNEGFVYIATPTRGGRTNKEEYKNVKGVGHFLLDASAVPGKEYQHEYNRAFLEKAMKNNDWIPTFTPVSGDKVRLKYKKPKEITKEDKVLSPLRQFKFDNIMFDNTRRPEGFEDPIKEVLTKDNKGTYLIFKNKDGYSRFSGGSVVFIFKDKYGNTIVRDFAGTLNNIKDEGKAIKEQYGLKDGSLTIGYHDVGSFSAKPKADKSGVLRSSQWYDFNTGSMTGGALLIPNQ